MFFSSIGTGTAIADLLRQYRERAPADRGPALRTLLAERVGAILRLAPERLAPEAPLAALGLDSLSAAELKAEVASIFGVNLPFSDLLEGASLATLAAQVEAALLHAGDAGATGVEPEPPPLEPSGDPAEAATAPLSLGQRALWYLHRLAPESAAYILAGAARLPAEVERTALGRALQALVDRHDALRATLHPGADGPVQRVAERAAVAFTVADAALWSAEELRARLAEAAFAPFDLEQGPMFRARLFTRPDAAYLVLAAHHAAADFASLAVIARELGILYDHFAADTGEGEIPLPALPLRFADYARWQDRAFSGAWGDHLWEHWRERLTGAPPLDLPTDRPRPPAQSFKGASRGARLGRAELDRLGELARSRGATLFMALLAGFEILLARTSGQEDFVVGSPSAGRLADRFGDRLAGLVGYFVNPLPLRADTAGDPTAGELLERARRTALLAFEHQDLPFALLAERLRPAREAERPPVFQVMLTLQKAPEPDLAPLAAFAFGEAGVPLTLGGLRLESMALAPPGAAFDLTLMAAELDGELAFHLQWSADLFDPPTAGRLLAHFKCLLAGMSAEPGRRLSELPFLTGAEQAQLAAWNDTAMAWDLEANLGALVVRQARRTPGEIAVEGEEGSLTYGDLLLRARRLAAALRASEVGAESRVGIYARRSPEMVVGLLGVLLAGGAYVPLEPDYPPDRLAFMVEDAGVRVLLAERGLPALGKAATLYLDAGEPWKREEPGPEEEAGGGDGLAYLIYTSGSTGRPKGAMNTHRGIVNRLLWMQQAFGLTAADRVLHKTPLGFDVSVWELFWPLLTGACLVLARPGGHQDPAYLVERIAAAGVTTLHFVPSMLQAFLDEPDLSACAALRRVMVSGEALPRELARRFYDRLGDRLGAVELHNLYGPTEAAVDVTWWPVAAENLARPVPIGTPIANTRIHLLDRQGGEVGVSVSGEIHIGGVQLARGYGGRPDGTAASFVPDPLGAEPGGRLYKTGDLARRRSDGAVEFLGRLDHQVKLRGVRIELEEVEAALAACPGVREAVAGVRGTGAEARLAAWVVAENGQEIDVPALRAALRQRLPELMIPSLFAVLPALPVTPNSKVDRRALPAPETGGGSPGGGQAYVAPRTPVEAELVGIWQALLGVERIGVEDHFFDLGGHSLLATRLMARVRDAFGVNLPLSALFENGPTVAGLAQAIDHHQVMQADDDDLVSALRELDGLSEEDLEALLESEGA